MLFIYISLTTFNYWQRALLSFFETSIGVKSFLTEGSFEEEEIKEKRMKVLRLWEELILGSDRENL